MADKKISALTAATTPLAGTEVLPIVQSGATVKATVANIVGAGTSPGSFTTIAGTGPVTIKQTSDYSSAGSGVNVVKSNTTDVWTTYVGADTAFGVAYGATVGASNRLWAYDTTGNLFPQVAAKGVNFTANTPQAGMTSQLLNWYEEGTFTPTLSGATTTTYTTQTGRYTRVGRLVTFQCELEINLLGNGSTTTFLLGTLPNAGHFSTISVGYFGNVATAVSSLTGYINSGANSVTMQSTTIAATSSSSSAIFGASARIIVSGQYSV